MGSEKEMEARTLEDKVNRMEFQIAVCKMALVDITIDVEDIIRKIWKEADGVWEKVHTIRRRVLEEIILNKRLYRGKKFKYVFPKGQVD